MQNKIYKPLFDKLFWWTFAITVAILAPLAVVSAFHPVTLLVTVPVIILTLYVLISPFWGYVELREDTVFIKFGLILKKEIPYSKIRDVQLDRKFYSESIIALKNSIEHLNIKYNRYDAVTVSVKGNEAFMEDLNARLLEARRTLLDK